MTFQRHQTPRRLSISTWSLHHALGSPPFFGIETKVIPPRANDGISLLELPARLADFGIRTMEVCHFHLPSRESDYLRQLRAALEKAEIELWSLLLDDGDISHPQHGARDTEYLRGWLDVAQSLGARCARVSGGHAPTCEESLQRSASHFRVLADDAERKGLRLMTENWHETLSTPQAVHSVLESLDGAVGLCLDFGNWDSATKYDDLRSIAPLAESCHAKAHFFDDGKIDETDYRRYFEITRETDFSGPYTLIYSSPGDEWRGLQIESEVARDYL